MSPEERAHDYVYGQNWGATAFFKDPAETARTLTALIALVERATYDNALEIVHSTVDIELADYDTLVMRLEDARGPGLTDADRSKVNRGGRGKTSRQAKAREPKKKGGGR